MPAVRLSAKKANEGQEQDAPATDLEFDASVHFRIIAFLTFLNAPSLHQPSFFPVDTIF